MDLTGGRWNGKKEKQKSLKGMVNIFSIINLQRNELNAVMTSLCVNL